ncbi:cell division protein FtsA [Oceanomicrobium pacificus]|uniref:Cell division protein FtsA n=1 Tax=Oceanomicrobium pacificus TaxID=2692916 RepID=A0A6B0U388_9RHOB|nr:cell division protein FtsA [Oceanomicrobium pacificus]MXU65431.1 cell division protein FtsA [Oceanomicrobium pacificus]
MSSLFQEQRKLRQQREVAIRRGVVAVLDIGTTKLACLILQFVPPPANDAGAAGVKMPHASAFRVIGVGTVQSHGVEFGDISAMDQAENAIRNAIQKAQKMAGQRVDHAIVCFSGGTPRSYGVEGVVEVANGEVVEQDIGNVLAHCDIPDFGEGREVVHALPVNFTLDHRTGLSDPRGQIGSQLAVDMHLLTVADTPIHNIIQCVRRCDLELSGIAVSSYTSGLSSLVEDEQELGAACVDLGGGATGISVFLKRQLIYADAVRLGGVHVTRDLSAGLHLRYDIAERLKTMHGGLVATGQDDRDVIELADPKAPPTDERRTITRSELIGIMRPRMEEILEDVRARLDAAGFDSLPSQRIVLTGGGSQTPGLETLAQHILGRQVRIGRPMRVHGLPQLATGPGFASAVGLALHISNPQDECWDFDIPADRMGAQRIRRAVRWFRDNW